MTSADLDEPQCTGDNVLWKTRVVPTEVKELGDYSKFIWDWLSQEPLKEGKTEDVKIDWEEKVGGRRRKKSIGRRS